MSEFSIRTQPFRLKWADYAAVRLTARFIVPTLCFYIWLALGIGLPDLLKGDLEALLWCLAVSLGCGLAFFAAGLFILWLRYRRDPVMNGERLMVLDGGGVRLVGHGVDVRRTWATMSRIREGHEHVFLYMAVSGAYIMPKRAFSSAEEIKRLIGAARVAIRASRTFLPSLPPLPEAPDNRETWLSRPYRPGFVPSYSRVLTWIFAAVILVMLLAGDVWLVRSGDIDDTTACVIAILVMAIPLILVAGLGWWLISKRRTKIRKSVMCFTRDYVRCTSPAFDTRIDWTNIRKVYRVARVFIFRLETGLLHVPASAFATRAEAEAFFAQAVAFWRAAEARR